jgi:hypothetical protein
LVGALQKETADRYNIVFDELEKEADNRKVDRMTALPDRETKLNEIRRCKSIPELQLRKAHAGSFKSGILEGILRHEEQRKTAEERAKGNQDYKAAEPVEFYISRVKASISNETELAEFLEKLKHDMLNLLHDNKTIIIKE